MACCYCRSPQQAFFICFPIRIFESVLSFCLSQSRYVTFLLATQDHQDQALPNHHRAGEETQYLLTPISLMVGFITDDFVSVLYQCNFD